MGAPLRISSVRDELDVAMIHRYLSETSYWKRGVALETVRKGIENALCFGGYVNERQVAFARVVTDYTDFAYLRDVFVLPVLDDENGTKAQDLLAHVLFAPETQIEFNKKNYSSGSFNMDAGVGLDLSIVTLETGVSYGLSKAYKDDGALSGNAKYFTLYATLGLVFGGGGN